MKSLRISPIILGTTLVLSISLLAIASPAHAAGLKGGPLSQSVAPGETASGYVVTKSRKCRARTDDGQKLKLRRSGSKLVWSWRTPDILLEDPAEALVTVSCGKRSLDFEVTITESGDVGIDPPEQDDPPVSVDPPSDRSFRGPVFQAELEGPQPLVAGQDSAQITLSRKDLHTLPVEGDASIMPSPVEVRACATIDPARLRWGTPGQASPEVTELCRTITGYNVRNFPSRVNLLSVYASGGGFQSIDPTQIDVRWEVSVNGGQDSGSGRLAVETTEPSPSNNAAPRLKPRIYNSSTLIPGRNSARIGLADETIRAEVIDRRPPGMGVIPSPVTLNACVTLASNRLDWGEPGSFAPLVTRRCTTINNYNVQNFPSLVELFVISATSRASSSEWVRVEWQVRTNGDSLNGDETVRVPVNNLRAL